jgi:hypothetical protein
MSLHATTILGYVSEGEAICPDCFQDLGMDQTMEVHPVFGESEGDLRGAVCAGGCGGEFRTDILGAGPSWFGVAELDELNQENEL